MMPGFVENIAFAKLILKRPAYLGRDNQPDLSENNPQFSLFHLFLFLFFLFPFLSFFSLLFPISLRFLSSLCSAEPTRTSLTAASANRDRHCLSTHPTDEAAFPFSVGIFVQIYWRLPLLDAGPLLENKYASSVDRQLYSPACVLH